MYEITPEDILNAYCNGIFPMAESADDDAQTMGWYDPPQRGVIELEQFHIPRSLKKTIRKTQNDFIITINQDFEKVIDNCAAPTPQRPETWINQTIKDWFITLHSMGFAHSIEYRDAQTLELRGGLYGLAIGKAFFGESMYSAQSNASRIILVALVAYLKSQEYSVFDTQFVNDHLVQFGCITIPKAAYIEKLHQAIPIESDFKKGLEKHTAYQENSLIPQGLILQSLT